MSLDPPLIWLLAALAAGSLLPGIAWLLLRYVLQPGVAAVRLRIDDARAEAEARANAAAAEASSKLLAMVAPDLAALKAEVAALKARTVTQ
jgi:hypothetical protein